MKFNAVLLSLTAAVLVSACSNTRDVADGDFGYLDIEPPRTVGRDGELQLINPNNRFAVPEIPAATEQRLGDEVSIRPPRQVIAAAPGSRIEEGLRESRVYFDIVEGMTDLKGSVWEHMLHTIDELGVNYSVNEEQGLISTDRYRAEVYSVGRPGVANRIRGQRIIAESEQTVELEFTLARHGRSGVLEARVADPVFFVDGERQTLPMNFARSYEAQLLNSVSSLLARAYQSDRASFARQTVEVQLGTNRAEQAAYTLATDFATAWVLMPGVFAELNFHVDDLNQSEGIYYVSYEPFGNRRWYSRLAFWRRNQETPLGIDAGTELTFSVDELDGTVYIVPHIEGEALDAETLEAWFPNVADAFSAQRDR